MRMFGGQDGLEPTANILANYFINLHIKTILFGNEGYFYPNACCCMCVLRFLTKDIL